MAVSVAIVDEDRCPNCGEPWRREIWLLVDARERPDLIERMLAGSFDHLQCPHCREPAQSLFPLLLYRPGCEPAVLLSTPGATRPSEDETQDIGRLLAHLRHSLGGEFRPEWLARGVPLLAREDLADFLRSQLPQTSVGAQDLDVEILMRYVRSRTWDDARSLLTRHPQLLEPRMEAVIEKLGLDEEPRYQQELRALRLARAEGLDEAFEQLFGGVLGKLESAEKLLNSGEYADAFELLQEALPECSREDYPLPWAWLNYAIGSCLVVAPLLPAPERWMRAADALRAALSVYEPEEQPNEWGASLANLALAFEGKERCGGRSRREEILRCLGGALQVFTPDTDLPRWVTLKERMSRVLLERPGEDPAEEKRAAMSMLEEIATICSPDKEPAAWLRACVNLCGLYRESVDDDPAANVERAIHVGSRVMRSRLPLDDQLFASLHSNLGAAYDLRVHGDHEENKRKAIHHLTRGLQKLDPDAHPVMWATVQHNLGHAYLTSENAERETLDESIKHFQAALTALSKAHQPADYAHTLSHLAMALTRRAASEESMERALGMHLEAARMQRRVGRTVSLGATHIQVAHAYLERERGDPGKNRCHARRHCLRVLEGFVQPIPALYLQEAAATLVTIAFEESRWHEVLERADQFFEYRERRLDAAYVERSREGLVARAAPVFAMATYARVRLGRFDEALAQLEQGKTQRMNEVLVGEGRWLDMPAADRRRVGDCWAEVRGLEEQWRLPDDMPGRPSIIELTEQLRDARSRLSDALEAAAGVEAVQAVAGLSATEILEIVPENGAIVSWLLTPSGSVAFVLTANDTSVTERNIVWLDYTSDDLQRLIGWGGSSGTGWIQAYSRQSDDPGAWDEALLDVGRTLWTHLIGPVVERLGSLGTKSGAEILLLPDGNMSMLPLHAAWRPVDGEPRFLLDDYVVWFAPSASAYRYSRDAARACAVDALSILTVVDSSDDLDYARIEGSVAAGFFPGARRVALVGADVRPQPVIQHSAGKSHIHFACHGFYAWSDPMRSALVMADRRSLALWEVLAKMDLQGTRLVTLSACETALTDVFGSPQEFTGLPSGFMQAGAAGVIGTLWEVDDLSTLLLMREFYRRHIEARQPPAVALRGAQIWLRTLSEPAAKAALAGLGEVIHEAEERARARAPRTARQSRAKKREAARRPFQHPFYWAGFAVYGS